MDDFWEWYGETTTALAESAWTEDEFWDVVNALHGETQWNYGTCTIDVLWAVAPDVALDVERKFDTIDRQRTPEDVQGVRDFMFG